MHRALGSVRALAGTASCTHLRVHHASSVGAYEVFIRFTTFFRLHIVLAARRSWYSIHQCRWIVLKEFHHIFPLWIAFSCDFCLKATAASLSSPIFLWFKQALLSILSLLFLDETLKLFLINQAIFELIASVVDCETIISFLLIGDQSIQNLDRQILNCHFSGSFLQPDRAFVTAGAWD